MSLPLQPAIPSAQVDSLPTPSRETELTQFPSFDEVLKSEEKKLQEGQEINIVSAMAILAAMQQPINLAPTSGLDAGADSELTQPNDPSALMADSAKQASSPPQQVSQPASNPAAPRQTATPAAEIDLLATDYLAKTRLAVSTNQIAVEPKTAEKMKAMSVQVETTSVEQGSPLILAEAVAESAFASTIDYTQSFPEEAPVEMNHMVSPALETPFDKIPPKASFIASPQPKTDPNPINQNEVSLDDVLPKINLADSFQGVEPGLGEVPSTKTAEMEASLPVDKNDLRNVKVDLGAVTPTRPSITTDEFFEHEERTAVSTSQLVSSGMTNAESMKEDPVGFQQKLSGEGITPARVNENETPLDSRFASSIVDKPAGTETITTQLNVPVSKDLQIVQGAVDLTAEAVETTNNEKKVSELNAVSLDEAATAKTDIELDLRNEYTKKLTVNEGIRPQLVNEALHTLQGSSETPVNDVFILEAQPVAKETQTVSTSINTSVSMVESEELIVKNTDHRVVINSSNEGDLIAESRLGLAARPEVKNEANVFAWTENAADSPSALAAQPLPVDINPEEKLKSSGEVDQKSVSNLESTAVISGTDRNNAVARIVEKSAVSQIDPMATDVIQQITIQLKARIKSGENTIRMQLNPEKLGAIEVQMVHGSHGVSVNFITEQASTGQLLESQVSQLRQSLKEAGVQLVNLNINQHHQSNQEGGAFRQGQSFTQNPRRDFRQSETLVEERTRPLRIDGLTSEIDYLI